MPKKTQPPIWQRLRQISSASRRRIEQALKDANEAISLPDAELISASRVLQEEVASWTEAARDILAALEPMLAKADAGATSQRETLEARVRRALQEARHEVFGVTGTLIVDGIVHVEIDPRKGTIQVNRDRVQDLLPESVVSLVAQEAQRIQREVSRPEDTIRELRTAYERHILQSGGKPGQQIPLLDLLPHLALAKQTRAFLADPTSSSFRAYPLEVFRADIYSLLRSGMTEADGRLMRHAPGADTKGALFLLVPALGRPAHVGRIWFEAPHD